MRAGVPCATASLQSLRDCAGHLRRARRAGGALRAAAAILIAKWFIDVAKSRDFEPASARRLLFL